MTNICYICYNDIDNCTNNKAQECGHRFHLECLVRWIDISPTCPICRYTIIEKNKMKIPLKVFLSILCGLDSSICLKEGSIR
jgi:hypothetical protein